MAPKMPWEFDRTLSIANSLTDERKGGKSLMRGKIQIRSKNFILRKDAQTMQAYKSVYFSTKCSTASTG